MPTRRARIRGVLQEVIAPLLWVFAIAKLFVFDVDVHVIANIAPNWQWVLDFKFFGLLATAVALLLVLGTGEFWTLLAFVAGYPFVVLFWRVPQRWYRHWPIVVAFSPAIFAGLRRLKATFLLYSLAGLSAVIIIAGANRPAVIASIFGLVPLLIVHLYRSIQKAYASGLVDQLVALVKKLRLQIEAGTFAPLNPVSAPAPTSTDSVRPATTHRDALYALHGVIHIVADRVKTVTRRRYYDLYLLASWSYTVCLTVIIYGVAYLGINKAWAGAFAQAQGAGLWSFIGFSFGKLSRYTVSAIMPSSAVADFATYSEGVCAIMVFIVLLSSFVTGARESFRSDLDDFAGELRGVGSALEARTHELCQMTFHELEMLLVSESPTLVSSIRTFRGLPAARLTTNATNAGSGGRSDDQANPT